MNSTPTNNTHPNSPLIILGCLTLFFCMIASGITAAVGWLVWQDIESQAIAVRVTSTPVYVPSPTGVLVTITPNSTDNTNDKSQPTPIPTIPTTIEPSATKPIITLNVPTDIDQRPIPDTAFTDLERLHQANYPPHDYYEVPVRFGENALGPRTITVAAYEIGDTQDFYDDNNVIEATLLVVTEHAYFWVDDELTLNEADLREAAEKFETDYYPQLTNLFGEVWTPGIDNNSHFTILHFNADDQASELGYFTDINQYPQSIFSQSNEQEMVYLNMSYLDLGTDLYYGTLVHEVQHLIHWHVDANETTWLNEGLAQLAELYLELDTVSTSDYLRNPEIRLNSWAYDDDIVDAHYAGAYLYMVYLWEQLGETAVQELARHPANGMASVYSILQGYAPERSLAQFTADWAVATYLDDDRVDARYAYRNLNLGDPRKETRIRDTPYEETHTLNQFGVHYLELDLSGKVTVSFAGDTLIDLYDSPPDKSADVWFVPSLNDVNASLTTTVDLGNLEQATLTFNTWYDLESDWDFAYLSVSTDDGASWQLLTPDHRQIGDYGPAFNGRSHSQADDIDGWIKESIPLNSYLGQVIQIRFDVLTDSAILGQGFALSNIAIPELERELTRDQWNAQGFVQVGAQLPQQWAIRLIQNGDRPQVTSLSLDPLNQGQWSLEIGPDGGVLVVTALTPFTDETANYWLTVEK